MSSEENIFYFLKDYKFMRLQLAFCVDVTGSMGPFITEVKKTLKIIMDAIKNLKLVQFEFAFLGYRDHTDESTSFITKYHDFTDPLTLQNFIKNEITANGGGDLPEAVLYGLNECTEKLSWKQNSIKIVIHLADAPPHGTQFDVSKTKSTNDRYENGCPKGNTVESVAKKFKEKEINYVLIDCDYDQENKKNPLRLIVSKFGDEDCIGYFLIKLI